VRRLDLALFLLGETAMTQGELARCAAYLGYHREPPDPGQLMRVQPARADQ
jgi:hypothetical protein